MRYIKRFILEIEIDEKNIAKKYPNYIFNFNSPKEFMKHLLEDIIYDADTNTSKKGLKEFGYSKKIIKEIKVTGRK